MNHEQQVGTACKKCIQLNVGCLFLGTACEKFILLNVECLFSILLQSIQQENYVTKGLVKNNTGKSNKMQKTGGWG
jgi:hypothetical protein